MTDKTNTAKAAETAADGVDYSQTLFLPQTEFPMRAGLPQREPELLARWAKMDLYRKLREAGQGRDRFVLHDGPPYANGNIHIGHALNKVLKDLVTRSQQMLGYDSNYVPGWDCHGLPIEWKIEEQYRAKGLNKDDVPVVEFRKECRAFAEHWVDVQREEFKRLGVEGDWANPYLTMAYPAEAQIAREIMKFAETGQLYRGSKPVMWSVVEKTALAEAEVEYEEHISDTIYVAFPIDRDRTAHGPLVEGLDAKAAFDELLGASIVIWTTTPWTIPGNRAISFNNKVAYGLYRVTAAAENNWAKVGATYILAKNLAEGVFKAAKVEAFELVRDVPAEWLPEVATAHPLRGRGYDFIVPLLDGDHVTDDAGTGFVHTAPSHGREDFDVWMANGRQLTERGIETRIPYTVDADGRFTKEAPGFEGAQVITDKGDKGNANDVVIKALVEAGNIIARGRLKHQYPHSWRSKKPVIFRNTPQWFIAMDKPIGEAGAPDAADPQPVAGGNTDTLRNRALKAIKETEWVPAAGENRITGMIANRPDWVVSRQRAWGVPITVFVEKETKDILVDAKVNAAIAEAFEAEGADAWFTDTDGARFLKPFGYDPAQYERVTDVLDVWFDSGSTHAFTLEKRGDLRARRRGDGGKDRVMYLEGSDQHRGWFHSSLLESCGTRGRAPYDIVLTHGFCLDEKGEKMSKSKGNVTAPQDIIKDSGADILRLWVAAADYSDDLRIGKEILKTFVETYRKLRNTMRWMLGTLAHFSEDVRVADPQTMPELERLMLHRLAELGPQVEEAYRAYDYKKVVFLLSQFMNTELSAFYFDVRKDALYCDPLSSHVRKSALTVVDHLFRCLTTWLAPILVFTAEEAWLDRYPDQKAGEGSVHLERFVAAKAEWLDPELAERWAKIRRVRRVVTGALELERAAKRIGSSLEAAPQVFVSDSDLYAALSGADLAEISITSGIRVESGEGPAEAFRLADVPGVAVVPHRAAGIKCARSWKYFDPATADKAYPQVTPRDAKALKELGVRA
ncbi:MULTISPECIES: isoleucine--tRNA ligase [Bosea]|uniref:isoleucine--tRNA ligase n=1 Tax=Bosea TaxID=85413 RepID=UPI00215036E3|nr:MULTISPECIES: isoleucine--tRNA ligase [Bosea]MCR4521253.1 isoleucine--tRNA ligase [Bosea sp. 47.2.35]MDR6826677.1 isoleucyl-tRNA synthetase [Bosea robiniae]MDR6893387.1 isoleucyl-tRNA synthetase [Bosea sp. BE109]MDR7136914.1 isoleucyl-tRNA synthetase [Bosea sp. BE168]MDR7173613.1 isoleucyl-tRNA synthetase [Bosea sp. BE271]